MTGHELGSLVTRARAAVLRADLSALPPTAREVQVGSLLAPSLRREFGEATRAKALGLDGSLRQPDFAFTVPAERGRTLRIAVELKLYKSRSQGAGELDRAIGQCRAYAQDYDAVLLVVVFMVEPRDPLPDAWRYDAPADYLTERRTPVFLIGRALASARVPAEQHVEDTAESPEDDLLNALVAQWGDGSGSRREAIAPQGDARAFLGLVATSLGLTPSGRNYVTKALDGVTIGIDDSRAGRRVHAFTHAGAKRAAVNARLLNAAPRIAASGMSERFPQLSDRVVRGDPVYIGWEWTKTDTDRDEARMALELVDVLKRIIDRH